MTLKTLLNYCKYSGVWINIALNPYHWRLWFDLSKPNDMDPGRYSFNISIGPISIKLVLDDGSW
jgi:hypothetical protein